MSAHAWVDKWTVSRSLPVHSATAACGSSGVWHCPCVRHVHSNNPWCVCEACGFKRRRGAERVVREEEERPVLVVVIRAGNQWQFRLAGRTGAAQPVHGRCALGASTVHPDCRREHLVLDLDQAKRVARRLSGRRSDGSNLLPYVSNFPGSCALPEHRNRSAHAGRAERTRGVDPADQGVRVNGPEGGAFQHAVRVDVHGVFAAPVTLYLASCRGDGGSVSPSKSPAQARVMAATIPT